MSTIQQNHHSGVHNTVLSALPDTTAHDDNVSNSVMSTTSSIRSKSHSTSQLTPAHDNTAQLLLGLSPLKFKSNIQPHTTPLKFPVDNDNNILGSSSKRKKYVSKVHIATHGVELSESSDDNEDMSDVDDQYSQHTDELYQYQVTYADQLIQQYDTQYRNSTTFRRWLQCNYLHNVIDYNYLQHNEFTDVLQSYDSSLLSSCTIQQWNAVREQLGKPRRMSKSLFASEAHKLNKYRQHVRLYQRGQLDNDTIESYNNSQLPVQLKYGTCVTAVVPYTVHKRYNELSTARIIAYYSNKNEDGTFNCQYTVHFSDPHIGTHNIDDTDILYINNLSDIHSTTDKPSSSPLNAVSQQIISKLNSKQHQRSKQSDLNTIQCVLNLLDRKQVLCQSIQSMHINVQSIIELHNQSLYPPVSFQSSTSTQLHQLPQRIDVLKQRYAWCILQLEQTSRALELALWQIRYIRNAATINHNKYKQSITQTPSQQPNANIAHTLHDIVEHNRIMSECFTSSAVERAILIDIIPFTSSLRLDNKQGNYIRSYIQNVIQLVLYIQQCSIKDINVEYIDTLLQRIKPTNDSSIPLYQQICKIVILIKQSLYQRNLINSNLT